MSTSGSKSNEHVAHFLVDIHSRQVRNLPAIFFKARVIYRLPYTVYPLTFIMHNKNGRPHRDLPLTLRFSILPLLSVAA